MNALPAYRIHDWITLAAAALLCLLPMHLKAQSDGSGSSQSDRGSSQKSALGWALEPRQILREAVNRQLRALRGDDEHAAAPQYSGLPRTLRRQSKSAFSKTQVRPDAGSNPRPIQSRAQADGGDKDVKFPWASEKQKTANRPLAKSRQMVPGTEAKVTESKPSRLAPLSEAKRIAEQPQPEQVIQQTGGIFPLKSASRAQHSNAQPGANSAEIQRHLRKLYQQDGRKMPPMNLSQIPTTANSTPPMTRQQAVSPPRRPETAQPQSRKKPGLLQRIFSFGKKQNDEPQPVATRPQPQTVARRPQPTYRQPTSTFRAHQNLRSNEKSSNTTNRTAGTERKPGRPRLQLERTTKDDHKSVSQLRHSIKSAHKSPSIRDSRPARGSKESPRTSREPQFVLDITPPAEADKKQGEPAGPAGVDRADHIAHSPKAEPKPGDASQKDKQAPVRPAMAAEESDKPLWNLDRNNTAGEKAQLADNSGTPAAEADQSHKANRQEKSTGDAKDWTKLTDDSRHHSPASDKQAPRDHAAKVARYDSRKVPAEAPSTKSPAVLRYKRRSTDSPFTGLKLQDEWAKSSPIPPSAADAPGHDSGIVGEVDSQLAELSSNAGGKKPTEARPRTEPDGTQPAPAAAPATSPAAPADDKSAIAAVGENTENKPEPHEPEAKVAEVATKSTQSTQRPAGQQPEPQQAPVDDSDQQIAEWAAEAPAQQTRHVADGSGSAAEIGEAKQRREPAGGPTEEFPAHKVEASRREVADAERHQTYENTYAEHGRSRVASSSYVEQQEPAYTPRDDGYRDKMQRIVERTALSGFKGFCPVLLRDSRDLADAQPKFKSYYRGKNYYFSTAEAKAKFDSNPGKYAPANSGNDVVELVRGGRVVEGSLEYAGWYHNRLYLFTSAENLATFTREPGLYAVED